MSRNVVAVVNPRASQGGAQRWWDAVEGSLRGDFPELEVRKTEAPEHATALTREALEGGAELVIGVGGDGTNNEVLSGFIDGEGRNRFPHARLAIVATGTGGDFRRAFGAATPLEQARRIKGAAVRQVDYGVVRFVDHRGNPTVRPFLNVCSVGISGLVVRYVSRSGRLFGNTLTYTLASLRAILAWRNVEVRTIVDDADERTVALTLLVLGNGQYFGAGMWVCPNAELSDGLLDQVLLTDFRKLELVRTLGAVYEAKHLERPKVSSARIRKLRLEPVDARAEVLLDLDGEQPGRLPATFEVVPSALSLQLG
jgi:YegS/Rv2252/BmrU family lipid kinase